VLITVVYIVGATISFVGLIGFLAAKTRLKILAFVFVFFMVLLFLGCGGIGAAAIAFDQGLSTNQIANFWEEAVSNNDSVICNVQQTLQCSGVQTCCNAYPWNYESSQSSMFRPFQMLLEGSTNGGNNNSAVCSNVTVSAANLPSLASVCMQSCYATNAYMTPCDTQLQAEIKKHIVPIIIVAFGLAAIMAVAAIAAIGMVLKSG